ncbi:MAG: iron-containing alcohol dehydrogenase [Sulfuricurvum sp.]|uniref:alcohol dehydrogenase-like regulatory protein ErcA n=1 Tax=Sulfuricurvum sp. TaxID=2025608 RepID=UPI002631C1A5|nr:alcohol dehydrogenase-like regulatory protein ErcA [Sulfuricurvum sp.]MDD2369491.1 iron-containing alcohol dehydrogenase [Sulfuricurvum sp.]MDD2950260.1 iron-containing alcohol dehydrogenase [Sulfuricurvum sp.]MDD5119202.1 iron-containing alcohol dehydrogenase [Sulfuricurvum sp.]
MNPNPLELRKFVVPEFVYGAGSLNLVGRYAKNFGAEKVLVVTDSGVAKTVWLNRVLDSLNMEKIPWVLFQDVTPNPKNYEVDAGVELFREYKCDVIIAVGGGSPMDCAKGIGIAFANDKNILEFEGVDEVPIPGPPLICIPTTGGSSADVSQFAIINDTIRKVKIAIISKTVVPDVALIDPETTTTMSSELTAFTGIDALVHAMEAYVSNASSPITDMHALTAIPLLVQNLIPAIAHPMNLEYRNNMMMGSLLAGMAFSNASLGLVHAMAHSLGGFSGLAHGVCNAILLNHVVDFNYPAMPERYDQIAFAMGLKLDGLDSDARKQLLLDALIELRSKAGINTTLSEFGITRADLHQLSINALNDACMATNPRHARIEEIEALYEKAL